MDLLKGEELKKQIGALDYVECSSKTQQVCHFTNLSWFIFLFDISLWHENHAQNIKAVFDAAIKGALQPSKEKKKKKQRGCSILWSVNWWYGIFRILSSTLTRFRSNSLRSLVVFTIFRHRITRFITLSFFSFVADLLEDVRSHLKMSGKSSLNQCSLHNCCNSRVF